jgi:uncharacterized protein (TIGR01777 family)
MNIVIVGATGMIGSAITTALVQGGHGVVALCRKPIVAAAMLPAGVVCIGMDSEAQEPITKAIAQADAVINLAGEPIGGVRWSKQIKERLVSSRVDTTRRIVDAIIAATKADASPALINASAVGYYGDCGDEVVTEEHGAGSDFLAQLCLKWETEAFRARAFGIRVAVMRIGLVLAPSGMLHKMLYPLPIPISPFKLGLGGRIGDGKQWMPWIHIDDVAGIFVLAATNSRVDGAINVTSPNPVKNAEFTRMLGRVLHRPAALPVPGFALRAVVGEFAEALLAGQRAVPSAAENLGYSFQYTDAESALQQLI